MKCRFLKWLISIYATDIGKMQRLGGGGGEDRFLWGAKFLNLDPSVVIFPFCPCFQLTPPPHSMSGPSGRPFSSPCLPFAGLGNQKQMMVILHFVQLLIKCVTQIIKLKTFTYKMSSSSPKHLPVRDIIVFILSRFFRAFWWTLSKTMVSLKGQVKE